jgi:hypothetical protein
VGVEYIEAIAAAHAIRRKMAAFLASYDVILSTTLAGPPPKLGYFDQNGDVQTFTERVTEYLSVTPLHNATGTPAMNVPLHWSSDGLPIGVSVYISRAAMAKKRPCWRSPRSWRRHNLGSTAFRLTRLRNTRRIGAAANLGSRRGCLALLPLVPEVHACA